MHPSALLFLFAPLAQEPADAGAKAPAAAAAPAALDNAEVQAIRAAAKKLAGAPSYTFQQVTTDEGGGIGLDGDGPQTTEFTAHVQQDKPVHFQQGTLEAWRQDGVLVYRSGAGAWERFEMGRGRGGRPQQIRVEGEDGWRAMRARMQLATAPALHDMLGHMGSGVAKVSRSAEGGKSVYTGELTPDAAMRLNGPIMSMGGPGAHGGPGGGQGGQRPPIESTASFRVVLGADGALESAVFDVLTKGSFGERSFERKRRMELKASAVGATALDLPAEAAAKLAEEPPAPADDEF